MHTPTPRRYRGPEIWAKVKAAYLAGEPAPSVCRRFDVGLANLRRRAGAEGWTRLETAIRDDPVATAAIPPIDPIDAPTYHVSSREALLRASQRAAWLLAEGRAAEADALTRAARNLGDLIERHRLDPAATVIPVRPRRA